jgi:hypothetical protein
MTPYGINMPNPHEQEDPREAEREQSTPILNHIYNGPAWRMSSAATLESIAGAFRVIDSGKQFAMVGNGEDPETRWMIFNEDLERLERA